MNVRRFKNEDADFCFKTRSSAFIQKFYDEIGAEAVSAGVNAFLPEDFIKMSQNTEIFILEETGTRKGFFTVKKINKNTAEIPLIYFDLKCLNKGFGSRSIQYIENYIKLNWKDVNKIILDTIIPKYNSKFYKKMGFIAAGETICNFPDLNVKAMRYEKYITK